MHDLDPRIEAAIAAALSILKALPGEDRAHIATMFDEPMAGLAVYGPSVKWDVAPETLYRIAAKSMGWNPHAWKEEPRPVRLAWIAFSSVVRALDGVALEDPAPRPALAVDEFAIDETIHERIDGHADQERGMSGAFADSTHWLKKQAASAAAKIGGGSKAPRPKRKRATKRKTKAKVPAVK